MKTKYSRGELEIVILKSIAAVGLVVVCLTLPGLPMVLGMFMPRNRNERYRIKRAYLSLQKKGLMAISKENGKETIRITPSGQKMLKYETLTLPISDKWDKKWRLISFDIPEEKRNARRALSSKLQELGAYMIQKSLYVFPYSCKEEIQFIGQCFSVQKHILYLETSSLENHELKLKKYFALV